MTVYPWYIHFCFTCRVYTRYIPGISTTWSWYTWNYQWNIPGIFPSDSESILVHPPWASPSRSAKGQSESSREGPVRVIWIPHCIETRYVPGIYIYTLYSVHNCFVHVSGDLYLNDENNYNHISSEIDNNNIIFSMAVDKAFNTWVSYNNADAGNLFILGWLIA